MKPKSDDEILKGLEKLSPINMLLKSAENNFFAGVKKAIEIGANINGMQDEGYYSALMVAAHNENIEMVEFLINNGADTNIQNSMGNTALILSVQNGNIDIIRILLNAGADVNIKNDFNENALYYVTDLTPNKSQIIELLKKHGAKE
jgi:ankyrin repeat protein